MSAACTQQSRGSLDLAGVDQDTGQDSAGAGAAEIPDPPDEIPENKAPSSLALSPSSVLENSGAGATVGQVTAIDDQATGLQFELIDSADGRFTMDDGTLRVASTSLDFEAQSLWTVTVRVTDSGGLTFDAQLPVTIVDANEPPTAITLSNASIAESSHPATAVGTLSTVDPDLTDVHVYSLLDDAGRFALSGNTLRLSGALDFEAQTQWTVTVRVTDKGGNTTDEQFEITVLDVNEAPTAVAISNASVAENCALGTVVGTLSSVDPELADTHVYTLLDNAGVFALNQDSLVVSSALDFEAKAQHTITVRSTDTAANFKDVQLVISVIDVANFAQVTSLADSGEGTLRETLALVDHEAKIEFAVDGTIELQSEILLAKTVSIENTQPNPVIISGGGAVSIFRVAQNASVGLTNLEITNGNSAAYSSTIWNDGTLSLTRTTMRDNPQRAVFNFGSLTMTESTIRDNHSIGGNGGLFNAEGATMTVVRSTISGNSSTGYAGAGVMNGGVAHFINSTISGNYFASADHSSGGGFYNEGTLTLLFCTVTGNSARYSGGIDNHRFGTVALFGSIVAGNTATVAGADFYNNGNVISLGYNVIGDNFSTTLVDGVNNDQVGTTVAPLNPLLDPLADYGGPTLTMRPQAVSPAVDVIPLASCAEALSPEMAIDQRGIIRAQNVTCDVGAVER